MGETANEAAFFVLQHSPVLTKYLPIVKEAAEKNFYYNITLLEQKKLAKLVVKKYHYTTEIKNGDVIVKQNISYSESGNDTEEKYQFLKYVMFAIAGLLSYLVFKVFLPSLSK